MAYGYKTGGRRKGTPNKRTNELERQIKKHCRGFNPVVEMIKLYQDEDTPPELKVYLLREITPYLFPKRKAVNVDLQAEVDNYVVEEKKKTGSIFEAIEKQAAVFEKLEKQNKAEQAKKRTNSKGKTHDH